MYIDLEFLCRRYNSTEWQVSTFFDKKEYVIISVYPEYEQSFRAQDRFYKPDPRIVYVDVAPTNDNESWERYIPTVIIDMDKVEEDFALMVPATGIKKQSIEENICIHNAIESRGEFWIPWITFLEKAIKKATIEWCEENNIKYKEND